MPLEFERCVKKVMSQINKRKNKKFTRSEAFAVCTAKFKKSGKKFKEEAKMADDCIKNTMERTNKKTGEKFTRAEAVKICAAVGREKPGEKKMEKKVAKEELEEPEGQESEPQETEESDKEVEILEEHPNQEIFFTESFKVVESEEGGDGVAISFTALKAGISDNGRRYFKEDLNKQNLKGMKMFFDHHYEADNAVGKILSSEGANLKLNAKAKVFNTARHPDTVELIGKGLIDSVSIGGQGDRRVVREKGKEVEEIRNLNIKEVSFVGIGGVPSAKLNTIGG